ncbi:MAG TPA: hypothetical protein PK156_24455 [Polyangium sp.]|nr:hypothetical protein [Polyangium sp.]
MSNPQFDPVQGKAAFDALRPRYAALAPDSLIPINVDAALAAVAALGVATRANHPEMLARFRSLPPREFDARMVEDLPMMAWACWYAATEDQKARSLTTDAKLPADLVQKAMTIEARMQACCEYYFNDHPELGPYIAMLRAGTGHRDLAADLLGYAGIYRDHYATVSHDKKHFHKNDADEAVQIAEQMLSILGSRLGPEGRETMNDLVRAWTLLIDTYEHVSSTGRWLLRRDPNADKLFPSLYALARTRQGGRGRKKDDAPALPTTGEG